MTRSVTASAPGSIMVIGEHAVVYGYPAIVCAVDQRITVRIETRSDLLVRIDTSVAPPFEGRIEALPDDGPLRIVSTILRTMRSAPSDGVDIAISSDIDPTLGLGSSAAVIVALIGAIDALDCVGLGPRELHKQALKIVRHVQGRGSGADLAASLQGGCLAYHLVNEPVGGAEITSLPIPPSLSLRYCGYKTPTSEVLARVAAARSGNEARFDALYEQMGRSAEAAIRATQRQDWKDLASEMTAYQELMRDLGVSDPTIQKTIEDAESALAAKISGSGLGDCVVALGPVPDRFTPVQIATEGLLIHDA